MPFIFEQMRTGGDRNLGYLIGDRERRIAILVDPSYSPELLIERAKQQKLQIKTVVNTHGHHDHINGNAAVKEITGARLAAHTSSATKHDLALDDGARLPVGRFELLVFHVPGHCNDHIVLFEPTFRLLLTGDHLFVGKVGGTATEVDAEAQFNSLHRLLRELPPETTVWPGHDFGCRPSSTLMLESATNPFLLAPDFSSFIHLKQSWPAYKREAGFL